MIAVLAVVGIGFLIGWAVITFLPGLLLDLDDDGAR